MLTELKSSTDTRNDLQYVPVVASGGNFAKLYLTGSLEKKKKKMDKKPVIITNRGDFVKQGLSAQSDILWSFGAVYFLKEGSV